MNIMQEAVGSYHSLRFKYTSFTKTSNSSKKLPQPNSGSTHIHLLTHSCFVIQQFNSSVNSPLRYGGSSIVGGKQRL